MDFLVFQYPMITVQACLDGILLGVLFALIAYGMALQWGVMNIIKYAQGDLSYSRRIHCLFYVSLWYSSSMGSNCCSNYNVFCWSWQFIN